MSASSAPKASIYEFIHGEEDRGRSTDQGSHAEEHPYNKQDTPYTTFLHRQELHYHLIKLNL